MGEDNTVMPCSQLPCLWFIYCYFSIMKYIYVYALRIKLILYVNDIFSSILWIGRRIGTVGKMTAVDHMSKLPQHKKANHSSQGGKSNFHKRFRNRWHNSLLNPSSVCVSSPRKRALGDDIKANEGKLKKMGNPELTRLWNLNPDNLAACKNEKR